MPIEVKMPQLFSSNDEGTIAKWLIAEGQRVNPGDVIAEIETHEATVEIEAVEGAGSPSCWSRKVRAMSRSMRRSPCSRRVVPTGRRPGPRAVAPAPAAEDTAKFEPTRATPQQTLARTRLVGAHGQLPGGSGFAPAAMSPGQAKTEFVRPDQTPVDPVAGWVVVQGPGRGAFRPLFVGMNSVGRDPTQRVCLSFGDETISREEHAFITYDEEQRCFYVQHGGKANLVRLGKQPVLVPVELKANDLIRLGRTTLRFVPCCGPDFFFGATRSRGHDAARCPPLRRS